MTHLTISFEPDPEFGTDVLQSFQMQGFDAYQKPERVRGSIPLTEIVIALGSAGAFAAIKDVINTIMGKHSQKSIYVKFKGAEIKLDGLSPKEGMEMLDKLLEKVNTKKRK